SGARIRAKRPSVCFPFGAGHVTRYPWRRLVIQTRPLLAAIDRALVYSAIRTCWRQQLIDPASATSNPCLQCPRVSGRAADGYHAGSCPGGRELMRQGGAPSSL